jgi:hypothetical protein
MVSSFGTWVKSRSGRLAPTSLLWAASVSVALLLPAGTPLKAQQSQQSPAALSGPIPGELEMAKMIWSTMVAVDHANRAGNYSVLRDLSAPGFQAANDGAKLTQIFASLRGSGIDLTNTLLVPPTYRARPTLVQAGMLRTQGYFAMRPNSINFDLYFQWTGNQWRLFGVAIEPFQLVNQQAAPAQPAKPARKP